MTPADVRDLVAARHSQFVDSKFELLDEGCDFRAFEVDKTWIIRIPKRPECATFLRRELRLLPDLIDYLPIPIPRYEFSGESNGHFFAGYKKLQSDTGDIAPYIDKELVARQLGSFLGKLHSYPVAKARGFGIPDETDPVSTWREKALKELENLNDLGVAKGYLRRYLEDQAPSPTNRLCLVHNDLWAEHILIERGSGQISAIIDWGDMAISDPAADLSGPYSWHGRRWLEDVLSSYSLDADGDMVSRARYITSCQAVHCIQMGLLLKRDRWTKQGKSALMNAHPE